MEIEGEYTHLLVNVGPSNRVLVAEEEIIGWKWVWSCLFFWHVAPTCFTNSLNILKQVGRVVMDGRIWCCGEDS